ncbi:hypothetical protein GCM10023345_15410 [Acinetobacter kookii]|uniref:Uncharacterized protein n=1 Tax=Acinetobacter kookii TaxID=1226327 RepID=A0A1G6GM73_9GAMM|nr:hypothetical protein [Acinetobacter kookii]SDB83067.1 hypothetical protein SAMN05421732_101102 [Acinetobacter kookii]
MANSNVISLQGELHLAKMVSGVPAALLPVGSTPELQIAISTESTDHYESKTGLRSKDAVLYKQTGVAISGTIEEVTKENLELILSGKSIEIPEAQLTDINIGTVQAGAMIDLGHRNLSNVAFKDSSDVAITSDKYVLDAVYGTVVFNEAIVGPVKFSAKAGAKTRTTIANNIGSEYRILFKGIDTLTGDKVVMTLWRVKFSPDTEFDLIHEDFGSYSIEGEALADISKANDAELSVFGHIERFSVTA